MRNFIIGVIVAVVAIAAAVLIYTRAGFAPVAADEPPGAAEKFILGGSLDPSINRHAPHTAFPLDVNDANIIQGIKVYQMNCANCHGGVDRKPSAMGLSLFPQAPQFLARHRNLDDPGWFTFYEIKHGIRRTGMPPWGKQLSDDDMWKLTMFLENTENLSPAVQQQIKDMMPNAGQ